MLNVQAVLWNEPHTEGPVGPRKQMLAGVGNMIPVVFPGIV